ncbi:MAG: AraC family transcriptional regulator [Bacillota bacterium]|nr:AraC family transcriptional regulator [Bacillota bacterium]
MFKVLLIAFNEKTKMHFIENWFRKYSYTILEATNQTEIIEILNAHQNLNIIIVDMDQDNKKALEYLTFVNKSNLEAYIFATASKGDFILVREAFRQGVYDFLLISELDQNFASKLHRKINQFDNKNTRFNEIDSTVIDLKTIKERFLREIIESDKIFDLNEKIIKYNIRFTNQNLFLCYFWIDDYNTISEKYDGNTIGVFTRKVRSHIETNFIEKHSGEIISLSPQEYLLFLSVKSNDLDNIDENLYDILNNIRMNLLESLNISASIGISAMYSDDKNIKELFYEARENVKLRFIFGKGTIITPEISKKITAKKIDSIFGKEGEFIKTLIEADKEKAQFQLELLLKLIRNSNPGKLEKIYASYMQIIYIIVKFINEKCYDTVEVFGENLDFYDIIAKFETQEEINEWIKDITDIVVSFLKEKRDVKVNRAILRVQEFIRNNYNNDLTLKMASDYVGLSESHLSNIFAKKTGQTFTDYLTYVRIEKAKELLETTNLKVYEVGVSVGYANVEHFSRVFKKLTGLSPNIYKNS